MELDKDLVRDLLLELEVKETSSSMSQVEIDNFANRESVEIDKVLYTIKKLEEADFINAKISYASDKVYWYHISSITYKGHEFLDSIRDPAIWKSTKETASKITGVSLTILSQIATSLIKQQLGL